MFGYIQMALAAVAAATIGALIWYAADADAALDREQKLATEAVLQRDAWKAEAANLRAEIADRNRRWERIQGLPEVRLRLCVSRLPSDGCCTPEGECRP